MSYRTHFLIVFSLLLISSTLHAQDLIWGGANDPNGSFDGGLNDWTVNPVQSADPDSLQNAVWLWKENGKADKGAYWGPDRTGIQSESTANGAAVFNSDYLDNFGVKNNFENGPAPAPHRSELISPYIDCSDASVVILSFYQYYRAFQSHTIIEVSVDGGPWNVDTINRDVDAMQETPANDLKELNISEVAAGQDSVRIKLAFSGSYYFWIVDDIRLFELQEYDLSIEEFHRPSSNDRQPDYLYECETMQFALSLKNQGSERQENIDLNAEVLDSDGNVVFSATETLGEIESLEVDTVAFSEPFITNQLDIGTYYVSYSISGTTPDHNPSDNSIMDTFRVSGNTWAKDGLNSGPGDPSTNSILAPARVVGNIYETCDFELPVNASEDTLKALNIHWAYSWSSPDMIAQLVDPVLAVLDDSVCNNTDLLIDSIDPFNHPQMEVVGFNQVSLDTLPEHTWIDTRLYDYRVLQETGKAVFDIPLEQDKCYLAGVIHALSIDIRSEYDSTPILASPKSLYDVNDSLAREFGIKHYTPLIRLELNTLGDTSVNSKNPVLPETAVDLYPNPVRSKLTLDFDLNSRQKVGLEITDSRGKQYRQFGPISIENESWSTSVQELTPGVYFLRIMTREGYRNLKFIKLKD